MSAKSSEENSGSGRGPQPSGPAERPGGVGIGVGMLRGLATTARVMLRPAHTAEYPDVQPTLPPRTRGVIALMQENCTVCMLCARECPDWCIYIDSHKETLPAVEGGRARQRNVLDRFAIDFSLCMYCGICVEVCPFDALHWSPEFEYAAFDVRDLLHERDRLGQWMATVPPPPPPDPGAVPPKEVAQAAKAAKVAETAKGSDAARPASPRPASPRAARARAARARTADATGTTGAEGDAGSPRTGERGEVS